MPSDANAHLCFQKEKAKSEAPTLICRAAQLPRMSYCIQNFEFFNYLAEMKKKRLRQVSSRDRRRHKPISTQYLNYN